MQKNQCGSQKDFSLFSILIMLLAWALWAMDPIVIYRIGQTVPRALLSGISTLIAGFMFAPQTWAVIRRIRQLSRWHLALIIIQAVFFTAISQLCYVAAIPHMNPGLVSAILRTQVAFAVFFAVFFLGERLNRAAMVGIALILFANLGLLFGALFDGKPGQTSGLGWSLTFLAALLWAGGTVSGKELLRVLTPAELVGVRMTLSGMFTLLGSFCLYGVQPVCELTLENWVLLTVKGVVTTGCALLVYYIALRRVKVYVASAMEPFAPLFTLTVAYLFFGKTVSGSDMLSVAILMAGTAVVILGNQMSWKHTREKFFKMLTLQKHDRKQTNEIP